MRTIDFRDHDQREHGQPADVWDFRPDPELTERIRAALTKRGEDAAFAAAERRMRGGA